MHQVGALVGRAHRARAVRGRLGDRFVAREAGPHRKAFPPIADELLGQRPFVQSTAGGPARGRRDPSRGSNRSMLVIRHHCEKAAVADEPRTFEHGFDVARKRRERAVVVWRTHDPGVHQLRRPEVVHESKRAGHDLAQAKRLDAPSSWCSLDLRSQRCPRVDRKREGPVFDELPEMQRPVRLVRAHQAVDHRQGRRVHGEASCGACEQLAAGRGRGVANRTAGVLHRIAAGGVAFVGGYVGSPGRHHDAIERHAQLVADHQRDGGTDALTDLHLAGAHFHAAVGPDDEPVLDARVGREARVGRVHRGDRGARLRTARSTLGCAPHRHRCGSRAARIAPSSGHGFLRRRAVIATTSPGVQ